MAKIAITGAAGFIGYHLAKHYVALGHDVVCCDSFNDYYDPQLKYARENQLEGIDGCEILDLTWRESVAKWIYETEPDLVIHLAAYAGVRYSVEYPQKYIDNNIIGTQNLIEACESYGVHKVVYASTSSVMSGNPLPYNEADNLPHQKHPYGMTKVANESQFMGSSIDTTIGLRFFTVYGPWGRPDMALFDFTKKIIAGEPITLFNNGDMIRDFTYIDDIVQGVDLVVKNALNTTLPKKKDIYNIGYGEQVQLMDFVDHIEKNLGRTAIKEYAPMHPADAHATWSDTTKLKKLGYSPTTSIAEGVEAFVAWYKGYYNVN
jgi:UDP-glucuronate 4-epimerase